MRSLLLLGACLAAASAQTCSDVTAPAPCGQLSDSEERCLFKGCCYNASAAYPCFYPGGDAVPITDVHVVQASHFDAGFAYTISGVLTLWWTVHYPRALRLGLEIEGNASYAGIGLQFMTHCWILNAFFNCPPTVAGLQCPTAAEQANVTLAINKGFLTWHAFPENGEAELHGAGLFRMGVDHCHALDDRFGLPHKTTMSQRDVPGTTRAVIPALLAAGVTAFSIGVNGASTPPFVPRAFMWEAPSGQQLLTLVHPYGYGGFGREDAVVVPGCSSALVFEFEGDNAGPPGTVADIVSDFAAIRTTFPGANVFSSTFDNFTKQLLQSPTILAQLPVIKSEIGDTWIHGSTSDPIRLAFAKRAGALAAACLAAGECSETDPVFANFTHFVLKGLEHTWGADIKSFIHDTTHWTNAEYAAQVAAGAPNFVYGINSWIEQRNWSIAYAIGALEAGSHPLAPAVAAILADLRPAAQPSPAAEGYAPFAAGTAYAAGRWTIGFDAASGAISQLEDSATGQVWASAADASRLAYLHYLTLSSDDYATFTGGGEAGYYPLSGTPPEWYKLDFGKPNVSSANPLHQEVDQALAGLWLRENATYASFLVHATFADALLHSYYGAPADIWLRIDVPRGTGAAAANISCALEIFNKTATRLPEGLFLRFNASRSYGGAPAPLAWAVGKLDSWVDPFDVVPGGNHHLHGFAVGVAATKRDPAGKGAAASLTFASSDAGVASIGRPWPLPTPVYANSTDATEGAGFFLVGNTWGTNYPISYPFLFDGTDANTRWRFEINAS